MWDKNFEETLRQHLPFLEPGDVLTADSSLRDLGLDSVGMVDLLSSLESGYAVRFTDDMLDMETFTSPGVLWSALTSLTASAA
ncbi:acyl carrier protein [Streptomyces sp. NRRL F-2747]|uniref:acyl carrier protein n=1 Tax=unclassified Streptomyces TaxID=2593676 RepID=UPI0004CB5948|nr:acyl carrier protein [Streptomyces sp. NRRL F-2747]